MTFAELKAIKKQIRIAVICLFVGVLCIAARIISTPILQESINSALELTSLDTQISSTTAELNALNDSIDASGKVFVEVQKNKDKYVKALGLLCDANKLNIHKLSADDVITDTSGLKCMTVNLELQGDMTHITNFISDISESEMICRVSTFSYRLSGSSFSWMRRAIDDKNAVGWWDISDVSDYLLQDEDETLSEAEMDLLDANAFMRQGNALCYLKLEFIGTEG